LFRPTVMLIIAYAYYVVYHLKKH